MHFTPSLRLQSRLGLHSNQGASVFSQPIPVFAVVKRRKGLRHYAACVFRGFHDPEIARQRPFMWTHEQAEVECHFPLALTLNYIWMEIGRTGPHGSTIDVSVNEQPLIQRKHIRGQSTIRMKLPEPRLATTVAIGIRTTTFTPASLSSGDEDARQLGIALQGVVFGKRRTKYRAGTFCRDSLHQRVFRAMDRIWGRAA